MIEIAFTVALTSATACALAAGRAEVRQDAPVIEVGPLRYAWVDDWLRLPADVELGNTHGVICVDSQGRIFFNTDTPEAVQIWSPAGEKLGAWGADLAGGVHGMDLVRQAGGEFLYLVHHGRGIWRKCTLDGDVLLERGAPLESGLYASAGEFHPTSIAVAPDGRIFVADGYGKSWVHSYDADGDWLASFGGPGDGPSNMACCHGLLVDRRVDPARLLVADREHHRIQVFDLDGRLQRTVEGFFRRPCSMTTDGELLVVPDLAGRVTILDREFALVGHLGEHPDSSLWAVNEVPRERWIDGCFTAPHSARWDARGDLYVMDWNSLGRVSKLALLR
jgi:sugar lactone lactonase YvrE